MKYDKRLLRVVFDHPQRRVKLPRVGIVAKGINFLETDPAQGMWVSPITGVLQSIPNSEEADYQRSNAGRFAKYGLSDTVGIDANADPGEWKASTPAGFEHEDGILYVGAENVAGVGRITSAAVTQNTGQNLTQYVYGHASDPNEVLCEFGWGATADYSVGVSCRVYVDQRVEIYRDGKIQGKGSFGGGGYQFGEARGGSYVRPSDEFVQIRAEAARDRYLLLTSSTGGVFQFACPWAIDTFNPDGTVDQAAQPILPSAKQWFRIPKGGCQVVWSKVQYAPNPIGLSEEFALSEPPTGRPDFAARTIPANPGATVTVVAPDGVSAFDPTTNRCRVKVASTASSSSPVWIDGVSARWAPVSDLTLGGGDDGEGIDVTPWLRGQPQVQLEDGPEGLTVSLEINVAIPGRDEEGAPIALPVSVDLLDEIENRPIRLDLVAHPADPEMPPTLILLDGVGGPPEFVDGLREIDGVTVDQSFVRITVHDRLALLKDAELTETVTFDGSDLCKPVASGDSAVRVCLVNGGFDDDEMDLPDVDFPIEHQPPQRAGDWTFEGKAGDKWWDVLVRLFDMAEALIWGVRPTATTPKFTVIDPQDDVTPKATLYRNPVDAEAAGAALDDALGAYPACYGSHRRTKLPIEGNLVRVMGFDPATQKTLTTFRTDDASRSPTSVPDGRWLGTTRTIKFESGGLTTQRMIDRVADSIAQAVSQRQYVEPWRSFMLFDDAGVPLWRGDLVVLDKAKPDGSDSQARISSMVPEIRDEHGGGLADETGAKAPVSIRLANYTGGALVGLGGAGHRQLKERHRKRMESGGWRGRGWERLPSVSPFSAIVKSL